MFWVTDEFRQDTHSFGEERPNLVDLHRTKPGKTEFTVIQLCHTLATLGLPRFSDVFKKGTNLVGVFEII